MGRMAVLKLELEIDYLPDDFRESSWKEYWIFYLKSSASIWRSSQSRNGLERERGGVCEWNVVFHNCASPSQCHSALASVKQLITLMPSSQIAPKTYYPNFRLLRFFLIAEKSRTSHWIRLYSRVQPSRTRIPIKTPAPPSEVCWAPWWTEQMENFTIRKF